MPSIGTVFREKKENVFCIHVGLEVVRILCKKIVLAIFSIPSLPDLLLTYSGLLGYIKVNLFSTLRTVNYTYLLYS